MTTVGSVVLGLVAVVVLVVRRSADRRRVRSAGLAVVTLGGDLARSVRSGRTLVEALDDARSHHAGPLAPHLDEIHTRLARGASLDESLEAVSRSGPASFAVLVRACRLGERSAGDVAVVLDGAVASIGDEQELEDETAALTAQAWTSVWVLAALPLVGAAVFASVDPRVAGVLTSTGAGRVCLLVGVALDAAGLWCAGRLVARTVR